MKKILAFALVALMAGAAMADWGLWAQGSYSSNTIGGVTQSLVAFDSYNYGTFDLTSGTLPITSYTTHTWKNGSSDVNGVEYFYTVYTGTRPGSPTFVSLTGGWLADLGGGDQRWGNTGVTGQDVLDWPGLVAGTTYTLEIYGQIQGNDDGNPANNYFKYDNNTDNAANYTATFATQAIPEPATMSLLGLGALAMVLRRKMSK